MASSTKLQRHHEAYARKQEQQNARNEKNAANNQYYQHWGKVTNRFENWTTPEYYEKASEKLRQSKENKVKSKLLEERQEKLRCKLDAERKKYEAELRIKQNPRAARLQNTETGLLEKVRDSLKVREDLKRRLELESKIYGRWRHGVDDETLLLQSKSTNQALAKLNWLDKQIENEMEREKEEKIALERNLRLQEEVRKTEEQLKERQKIREQEISEIRSLQEKHMDSLKNSQKNNDNLKSEMSDLQASLEDIEKVLSIFKERCEADDNPIIASPSNHNFARMKMIVRRRSEEVREELRADIDLLERVHSYADRPDIIRHLIGKLNSQLEKEQRLVGQIEAMYESEAKHCLTRCEDTWRKNKEERRNEIRHLLQSEERRITTKLDDNMQRQSELIDLRSTHLSSIENLNEKFKQLIKEDEESFGSPSPRSNKTIFEVQSPRRIDVSRSSSTSLPSKRESCPYPRLTDSFSNLNLDAWKDFEPLHDDIGSHRQSTSSSRTSLGNPHAVSSQQSIEKPKFGRKRVAWT